MNARKLQALRNLAERPGTEAEGKLAREILERWEKNSFADEPEDEQDMWSVFAAHQRGDISTDDFLASIRRDNLRRERQHPPVEWHCACGNILRVGEKCCDDLRHLSIQMEIRVRFKKGDRVFYNHHCYPVNCPGFVLGYLRPKITVDSHPWAWINVKFDHLKSPRQVPIYSAKGWHLSKEPIDPDVLARTQLGR